MGAYDKNLESSTAPEPSESLQTASETPSRYGRLRAGRHSRSPPLLAYGVRRLMGCHALPSGNPRSTSAIAHHLHDCYLGLGVALLHLPERRRSFGRPSRAKAPVCPLRIRLVTQMLRNTKFALYRPAGVV